ncbi:hypothetical protein BGZ70_002876 [Mortierella alpina]|uniref:alpha-galactosidase n=1 Tax=Mortierella alpina TaxID=64518 RepID=A0A9P6M581_MORAP|nr:hypothetical protein BGZ70_002876 [Mortierella alpina]
MALDANLFWTSNDIYTRLSEQPAAVEIVFGTDTDPLHFTSPRNDLQVQRLTLGPNDSKAVDVDASNTPAPASPFRLVVTSTLTNLSSRSCIRTIELSLDPIPPTTPPHEQVPAQTLPGRAIPLRSLRASFKCALTGKAMLANGYQSWSSSFASANESSAFVNPNGLYHEITQLGLASDMHIFDYPGDKGKVHSNLVTVIRDKCPDPNRTMTSSQSDTGLGDEQARRPKPEELVLCGSLSEDSGYTYFLMDAPQGQLAILQDCAGKTLRTNDDKLVLRTFFAWGDKDTTVWDAYAAQWATLYGDRRHIRSSLHHQLSGWTSWYCHYENINEHVVLENLRYVTGSGKDIHSNQEHINRQWPAKVFQIDDGYTVVGDWLDWNKDKFPRGMAFMASAIQEKGLIPGLWLAPFLVSKNARIVQEHPDWLVRKHYDNDDDDDGNSTRRGTNAQLPGLGCCNFGFQDASEFMLAHPAFTVGAYALDLEHPQVQAHLANVFRTIVQEWGFKMLKLDFLFAAAQQPRNHKTRAQLMWEAMQMVRTWAGPETILLGCGVPLGASFMVVDYCRIGCDVGAGWDTMQRFFHDREYISCFNSLTSTLARWALSGRFFGNDPDVFFTRDWNMGLTLTERRTLMLLNHLLGHLVFCSDPFDLDRMSAEQRELLELFFPWSSTPDVATPPFMVERVLQPLPKVKELYAIQMQTSATQDDDPNQREGSTYIVLTNLSSRRQSTNLRVMDAIVAHQNDTVDPDAHERSLGHSVSPSVYFHANTSHFGSAAAAYALAPRETCVFLRVLDSAGRLCGMRTNVAPVRALAKKDNAAAWNPVVAGQPHDSHQQLTVHLIATVGGSVLPTMEIESFHYEVRKLQFTVKVRPCIFCKKVTVWLAWKTAEQEAVQADMSLSLNGHALQRHPALLTGYGVSLASCSLDV